MKSMFMPAVSLLLTAGCATPNLRVWSKANIEANGAIGRKGKAVYYNIRIGSDDFHYDGQQAFVIRLPSGTLLCSDDFSESTIRPIALALLKTGDSVIRHDRTRAESNYSLGGVTFTYEKKQLVTVDISLVKLPEKSYMPEIAKTINDTFYPLPIPEEHLVEIFGAPDKISEFFIW